MDYGLPSCSKAACIYSDWSGILEVGVHRTCILSSQTMRCRTKPAQMYRQLYHLSMQAHTIPMQHAYTVTHRQMVRLKNNLVRPHNI